MDVIFRWNTLAFLSMVLGALVSLMLWCLVFIAIDLKRIGNMRLSSSCPSFSVFLKDLLAQWILDRRRVFWTASVLKMPPIQFEQFFNKPWFFFCMCRICLANVWFQLQIISDPLETKTSWFRHVERDRPFFLNHKLFIPSYFHQGSQKASKSLRWHQFHVRLSVDMIKRVRNMLCWMVFWDAEFHI